MSLAALAAELSAVAAPAPSEKSWTRYLTERKSARKVAVIRHSKNVALDLQVRETRAASSKLGIDLLMFELDGAQELEKTFSAARLQGGLRHDGAVRSYGPPESLQEAARDERQFRRPIWSTATAASR
jgi:hypothetical protein